MVGVMVQMKIAILRHGSGTRRTVGGLIGLALAIATVIVSVFAPLPAVSSLLAALMAVWAVGWILGPSGVGGGDQSLRPEYFALEPVPLRKVTVGLLASSFVGVTAPVTALAFLSLFTLAIRFGFFAALVALLAVPAQLVFVVLASRVVTALSGAALRTRIGVEVTAIQNAAVLAAGFSIYMLYQAVSQYTDVFALLWNQGIPAPYDTVLFALPTGWGVLAVQAAGDGNALLALGPLLGLAVLVALLLAAWTGLIRKRVTSPTTSPDRGGRGVTGMVQRFLPSGPTGAVIGRELRTWGQDPRRALELRTALWTGVLVCALGLLVGLTFMLPLAGLITIALAALMSLNVYALDGTALWQTILSPGAERRDVRGRQIAWLVVFVPLAALVSVGGIVFTGQDWAWPWVTAILPALIGAGVGFSVLFAVAWPAPGPEPHRHGGNPLDSGDVVGQFNVMFPIMLVSAVPPAAVTAVGFFLENPGIMWAGTLVGLAEGALFGWGLGRIAYRRLEKRGPELLNTLRWGWDATAGDDTSEESGQGSREEGSEEEWALFSRVEKNLDTMSGGTGALMAVLGLTFWVPFYQGAMSIIGVLVGTEGRSWHLPLYLPQVWQIPASIGMILLGALMITAMLRLLFRTPREEPSETATRDEDGDRVDSSA